MKASTGMAPVGIPASQMKDGDYNLDEIIGVKVVAKKSSQPPVHLPVSPAEASQGYRNTKNTGIHIPSRSAGDTPTSA